MKQFAGERKSRAAEKWRIFPCSLVPWLLCLFLLAGCAPAVAPTPVPTPLIPVPTSQPTPTLAPAPDSGWQPLRPGMEQRTFTLFDAAGGIRERVTALRLDPGLYAVSIAYRPGAPLSLTEWQAETGALLLLNGGFFTPEYLATGRIVVDGQASGASYEGFGGMLAVTAEGVEVRALAERPYSPDEPLQFALQSFPVLVKNSAAAYANEDGQTARRTAVGLDGNGRILFFVAPQGGLTLSEFSQFLARGDWELVNALNLDGGASSGLLLADPPLVIPAFAALPVIIAVYPR